MCALPRPRSARLAYGTRLVAGRSMEAGGGGAGRRGKTFSHGLNGAFVGQKNVLLQGETMRQDDARPDWYAAVFIER